MWVDDDFPSSMFSPNFIQVDCVGEGKDTCSKHGVSGYPTLKVFRNGEVQKDYDGPREASECIVHT